MTQKNNYIEKHLIDKNRTIKEALYAINSLSDKNLTLLVVDEQKHLVGTLTDGDIRRAILKGAKLDNPICNYMFKNYIFLQEKNIDLNIVKKAKDKGIKLLPIINNSKHIVRLLDLNKQHSILPIDAVIMAGGKGKRLLPLTEKTPKPMLPLGNKPIIEHNIDRLISYGVENIYISINYLGEQIKEYFGDGSKKGISIKYIEEDSPLGTIGALRNTDDYQNNDILVMNSDLFTNINFENFYIDHKTSDAAMTIASIPYTINIPYAILHKENGVIKSLQEKPVYTQYANAGIYLIQKKHIYEIPKNTFFNTTDLIEKLLSKNQKIIDSLIYGYWIDIGQHNDYKKAQEIIKHIKE